MSEVFPFIREDEVLVDVDGVVGGLMEGFINWFGARYPWEAAYFSFEKITKFNIPESPELVELNKRVDLYKELAVFMALPDCYQTWVKPIPGSQDALQELQEIGVKPVFVTATLKTAPESYVSKFHWCREKFGPIPMIAAPSQEKHMIVGRWAVDDRWDTCERYWNKGTKGLCFKQPWNETPAGQKTYNWPEIVHYIKDDRETWQ